MPVKVLLFNNQIYGLTKGQASPTSELGKITKSTPFGVADHPFNPVALALGAEATFVARTIDRDRHHLTEVLRAAATHEGAALVEIYQNCPVFNDGAFAALTDKETKDANQIRLVAGRPIRFGAEDERGVIRGSDGCLTVVDVADVDESQLLVHDPARADPGQAFSLAKLAETPTGPTPIGIFRDVERPVFRRGRDRAGHREPALGPAVRRRHVDRRLTIAARLLRADADRAVVVGGLPVDGPGARGAARGAGRARPARRRRSCARSAPTTRPRRRRSPARRPSSSTAWS